MRYIGRPFGRPYITTGYPQGRTAVRSLCIRHSPLHNHPKKLFQIHFEYSNRFEIIYLHLMAHGTGALSDALTTLQDIHKGARWCAPTMQSMGRPFGRPYSATHDAIHGAPFRTPVRDE